MNEVEIKKRVLERWCEFSPERVYLIYAIARKKENDLTNSEEVVFHEVIRDEEDIEWKLRKVYALVRAWGEYTFRVYLTVNARNTLKAYFNFQETANGWAADKIYGDKSVDMKFRKIDSYWKSELRRPRNRDDKYFMFDVDSADQDDWSRMWETLKEHTKPLWYVDTPSGYHIVSEPFNPSELETDVEYELKKDGMIFVDIVSGDP